MDLRIQKTLEIIEREFLTLRTKTPLNQIKVNRLCEKARINKSTFYRHYKDIFDLSDTLEDQTIDLVMRDFSGIDRLFSAPEEFIGGILEAINQHNQKILTLFGGRIDIFAGKIETRLKSHYLPPAYSPEEDIRLTFLIGGAVHVFLDPKFEFTTSTKTIAYLLRDYPWPVPERKIQTP
jgi:AcrR family transcriptional regulator